MLAAQRRAHILAAVRRDGVARVTELTSLLSVSDVTIRRDIETLASEGLVRRVHGGAVLPDPDETAESAAVARSGPATTEKAASITVGMLVPKSPYYFNGVVEGVRAELATKNGRLLLAVSDYAPEHEAGLVQGLLDSGAEALLLSPASADPENGVVADWVSGIGAPKVLVERRASELMAGTVSWVRSAHESGAAAAVAHLHILGHQNIGLFARGDTPTSRAVVRGWRQATRERGLPELPTVTGADISGWPRWNLAAVEQLATIVADHKITALLCHSDEDALALLQSGLAARFAVPGQLSIVAYDDEFADLTHPPLTAVSPPKLHVGYLATQLLLHLHRNPHSPAIHAEIQPQLVVRNSTAPAAEPFR